MNDSDMVDVLAEVAEKLGVKVRWEPMMGDGGICELRGKRYLFVDRTTSPADQVAMMASALCEENLESIYIVPEVRDRLEQARAERRARG
jgi:hypothetical protein